MSLINQLNATTQVKWLQTTPVDILHTASALVWRLMGNAVKKDNWTVQPSETVDGGKMVMCPIEYASSNSGTYGASTIIDVDKVDIIDAARFGWKGVYGSNTRNLDDITENAGDAAIIRLSHQYVESIKKSARLKMAADVVAASGSDPYHMNGLGDLFNTTTSTEYGSIAEDNMATWKANVITDAEVISFQTMQKIFRQVDMGDYAGALPNFCVTSKELVDGLERSLQPQQWHKDKNMVEAGWDHIYHKGAPVVSDKAYSGTTILDALNLEYLSLRAHSQYNFTTPVWKAISVQQPDTITANSRFRGNLYCYSRRMHVRHANITPPT